MATYLAFLRAVNVGGRTVPMAQLRDLLAGSGFTDVETYIQSGNVRLGSRARSTSAVETALQALLSKTFGFGVATLVRTPAQLGELGRAAPDSPLGNEARHYVSFLRAEPSPAAVKQLDDWDVDGEAARVAGREVHLWFTKSSHEAKLSNARIEKITGMDATNRNWTVVSALAEKWG